MKKYLPILFLLSLVSVGPVFAATIETKVNNYVSTGGNTTINGENIEGSSKSSVRVFTEINGQVVEDFEKEIETQDEFEFQSQKEADGSKVETEIKINKQDYNEAESNAEFEIESKVETEETTKEISFVRKILNYVFGIFKF